MEIIISDICGLCAGCSYAVNTAIKTAKENKNVVLFKEIVHNKNVNKMLQNKGIKIVDNLNNLERNSTVVLRAHGEPKNTYEFLTKNKINCVDCTCFNVKKIHEKVEEYSRNGYKIIIIGKHGDYKNIHPEVVGTIGWCYKEPTIIEKEEDLINFTPQNSEKYYLVCQTTFNVEKAEYLIDKIEKKCKNACSELIINKSLCLAQKNINKRSVELAKIVDFIIVVGGKNSSNSLELFNNVKNYTNAIFIEDWAELKNQIDENKLMFKDVFKLGLTAGASTPMEELEKIEIELNKIFNKK